MRTGNTRDAMLLFILALFFAAGLPGSSCTTAYAQGNNECLTAVRGAYKKLRASPADGTTRHIRYTVKTSARDLSKGASSSQVDLFISNTAMQCISKEMEIYRDPGISVMLLPQQKFLQVSDSPPKQKQKEQELSVLGFQDSIFTMCSVLKCENLPGTAEKRLVLQPNEKARSKLLIDRLTVEYNPESQILGRVLVEYSAAYHISLLEFDFHSIDLNSNTTRLSKNVSSLFFDGKGRLLEKYGSYKFSDVRKKSNH